MVAPGRRIVTRTIAPDEQPKFVFTTNGPGYGILEFRDVQAQHVEALRLLLLARKDLQVDSATRLQRPQRPRDPALQVVMLPGARRTAFRAIIEAVTDYRQLLLDMLQCLRLKARTWPVPLPREVPWPQPLPVPKHRSFEDRMAELGLSVGSPTTGTPGHPDPASTAGGDRSPVALNLAGSLSGSSSATSPGSWALTPAGDTSAGSVTRSIAVPTTQSAASLTGVSTLVDPVSKTVV